MSQIAHKALTKLLGLAENAWARATSPDEATQADAEAVRARTVSLRMSKASFPDYVGIPSHADKLACHGAWQLAAREGAIEIEWDRGALENNQVAALRLLDGARLAAHLGVRARWTEWESAHATLTPFLEQHPVLGQILERWRQGSPVRNTRAEHVGDWLDALRVVNHCRRGGHRDAIVRVLSVQLFADSKRIEALWPLLDVLTQAHWPCLSRDEEEVLCELGLLKFPPLFQIAIHAQVKTMGHWCDMAQPYGGLVPDAIEDFESLRDIQSLVSVENLTTFNEMSRLRHGRRDVAVIYTAGMPSPSWMRIYRMLLSKLSPQTDIRHWGDIDAGGFRIAAHLARACQEGGRTLKLLQMHAPASRSGETAIRKELGKAEVDQILRLCAQWAWPDEAAWIIDHPHAIEQESLEPRILA